MSELLPNSRVGGMSKGRIALQSDGQQLRILRLVSRVERLICRRRTPAPHICWPPRADLVLSAATCVCSTWSRAAPLQPRL